MMRRLLPNVCLFVALLTTLVPGGSLASIAEDQSQVPSVASDSAEHGGAEKAQKSSSFMFVEDVDRWDPTARFPVPSEACICEPVRSASVYTDDRVSPGRQRLECGVRRPAGRSNLRGGGPGKLRICRRRTPAEHT